jgi:hypothetical protein
LIVDYISSSSSSIYFYLYFLRGFTTLGAAENSPDSLAIQLFFDNIVTNEVIFPYWQAYYFQ